MKLLQIGENEYLNIDAIARVQVNSIPTHSTIPVDGAPDIKRKTGERFSLNIYVIGSDKTAHITGQYAHDLYDSLFPQETA